MHPNNKSTKQKARQKAKIAEYNRKNGFVTLKEFFQHKSANKKQQGNEGTRKQSKEQLLVENKNSQYQYFHNMQPSNSKIEESKGQVYQFQCQQSKIVSLNKEAIEMQQFGTAVNQEVRLKKKGIKNRQIQTKLLNFIIKNTSTTKTKDIPKSQTSKITQSATQFPNKTHTLQTISINWDKVCQSISQTNTENKIIEQKGSESEERSMHSQYKYSYNYNLNDPTQQQAGMIITTQQQINSFICVVGAGQGNVEVVDSVVLGSSNGQYCVSVGQVDMGQFWGWALKQIYESYI